ncbi:ABC transporter ATP-binding protein [Campylobacter sp. MIT 21-1685]|uniref:ABC transporter ATP-binding protein n=1 Tax=unclassified Campylobacter TaxID=2593542 RepID=UPI00224B4FA6|nr:MULTISPECIES: ABC transporter ATP-binding protein [unclassified Campylobacter]MCX2683077.1 ABC transporter ATP-binding protein [Campylobacter sp. MIT 21-1684]MCX2751359.1 ABC transporter ATP-binding protein [Campylobacter sp. MIT 21-1682]MCX2807558.1 ABC transporter ATP-binding protein [Campylobacter sp. MIT 21-1685]
MLEIRNLKKNFGNIAVLKGIDLDIKKGEIVSILGESGGGKSTLLRIIAGLEKASSYDKYQCKGKIAMMFQSYALFPHLNVAENILFALYDLKKEEKLAKLDELVRTFEISSLKEKKIDEISGGQAQRVAFARAVARGCDLLLLDEPFSNLDQNLKNDLRNELKKLIRQQGISAIMVTHDIEDAYNISDTIALLHEGNIVDYNDPKKLFFSPKNKKSASLLPNLNIIEEELDCDDEFFAWIVSKNCIFSYTDIKLGGSFEAKLVEKEFLGAYYRLKLAYKHICFFMLVSSSYALGERISFDIITREL